MSPKNDEYETLGAKHKKYNELVKNAIAKGETVGEDVKIVKNDLDALKKIDIAAHNKDIDYIINVLKTGDLLYISRALKQSPWLMDNEYAGIINLKYLKETLLPELSTKAGIKLMKHIQKNITDETRAEEFYKDENNIKYSTKLLTKCSLPFIEANIEKHSPHLELLDFVKLCKKSIVVFEKAFNDESCNSIRYCYYPKRNHRLQATIFLLETHTDKYLDTVEGMPRCRAQRFNAKSTDLIMKKAYDRVMNKTEIYLHILHIPTFVKFLKPEEIKEFLYKRCNDDKFFKHYRSLLFRYDVIKYFVERMPKDQRFEFVKQIFIDKTLEDIDEKSLSPGTQMFANKRIRDVMFYDIQTYEWYKFASFDVAFTELKKLMHAEPIDTKYRILKVLIDMASDNMGNIRAILKYYNDQHIKDMNYQKQDIINYVMSKTKVHKYDEETWKELDVILKSVDTYTDSIPSNQNTIEVILLYNLVNDKPVPEIITKNVSYYPGCLKQYKSLLRKEDSQKIFSFFYTDLKLKIENHSIKDEDTFQEAIDLVDKLLDLLNNWDKSISDYPFAIEKIRDLIKVKADNSWKKDLRGFYNVNKKWRKFMFEESIILYTTQDACINSLKHEPALLKRYPKHIETLLNDGKTSLKQFHKKLKVYWNDDLAEEWMRSYFSGIEKEGNQTEMVRGICILLSRDALSDILAKYAPETPKIDWDKTDNVTLGLQTAFAKNMHIARPQPTPDDILMYAKGDYLQYALPSLLAIYYNLSTNSSQEHIPKLLTAPVSLRKHGFRFAFLKFDQDLLEHHLSNTWTESQNISIRAVIFRHVFDRICEVQDPDKVKKLWKLLDFFMNNITTKEDPKLYKTLQEMHKVPVLIKPEFLVKNYMVHKKLYDETKNVDYLYNLEMIENCTRELMKQMDHSFVEEIIQKNVENKFFKQENQYYSNINNMLFIITAYVLTAENEEIQRERYEKIVVPIMKQSMEKWNENDKGDYYVRKKFFQLLLCFCKDLKLYHSGKNKMTIPTKIYRSIWDEIQSLPVSENYLLLTVWKLTLKITELIEKYNKDNWEEFCTEMAPELGKICLEYLREDIKLYFPAIYILLKKAMHLVFDNINVGGLFEDGTKLTICEQLLADKEFHEAYITVIKLLPNNNRDLKDRVEAIKEKIQEHPSVEVKMYYYDKFGGQVQDYLPS